VNGAAEGAQEWPEIGQYVVVGIRPSALEPPRQGMQTQHAQRDGRVRVGEGSALAFDDVKHDRSAGSGSLHPGSNKVSAVTTRSEIEMLICLPVWTSENREHTDPLAAASTATANLRRYLGWVGGGQPGRGRNPRVSCSMALP
jgi:hypothetical protein